MEDIGAIVVMFGLPACLVVNVLYALFTKKAALYATYFTYFMLFGHVILMVLLSSFCCLEGIAFNFIFYVSIILTTFHLYGVYKHNLSVNGKGMPSTHLRCFGLALKNSFSILFLTALLFVGYVMLGRWYVYGAL